MAIGTLKAIIRLEHKEFTRDVQQSLTQLSGLAKGAESAGSGIGKLVSFGTKLAGAFGLVTTATQLLNKELQVNGSLAATVGSEIQGTTAMVDSFFYALNNGNFDGFLNGLQSIIREAKDVYDALFSLKSFEASNQIRNAQLDRQIREAQEIIRDRTGKYSKQQKEDATRTLETLTRAKRELYDIQRAENKNTQQQLMESLAAQTRPDLFPSDKKLSEMSERERTDLRMAQNEWKLYVEQVLSGEKKIEAVRADISSKTAQYATEYTQVVGNAAGTAAQTMTHWYDESERQMVSGLKNLNDKITADILNWDKGGKNNTMKMYQQLGVSSENLLSNIALLETANNRYLYQGLEKERKLTQEQQNRLDLLNKIRQMEEMLRKEQLPESVTFSIDVEGKPTTEVQNIIDKVKELGYVAQEDNKVKLTIDKRDLEDDVHKVENIFSNIGATVDVSVNDIFRTEDISKMTRKQLEEYSAELQAIAALYGKNIVKAYNDASNDLTINLNKAKVEGELEIKDVKIISPDMEQLEDDLETEMYRFSKELGKERQEFISEMIKRGYSGDELQKAIQKFDADQALEEKLNSIREAADNLYESLSMIGTAFDLMDDALSAKPADNLAGWAATTVKSLTSVAKAYEAFTLARAMSQDGILPGIALGVAMAAAITNIIKSFPKFEQGGVVPGHSYYGDRVLVRLNSGERVLTRAERRRYESGFKDRTGTLNVRMIAQGRELVGVISNYDNYNATISKK